MKLILSLLLLFTTIQAHAEKWKMTTLEWPPFVCEKCPEMGAGAKALKEALKSEGIELELVILPWSRAIAEAADAKNYVGGYLYYPGEMDLSKGFVPSPAVFKSPVVMMEPAGKPLTWNKLSDLKGKSIGTCKDYNYGEEVMSLIKAGTLTVDEVASDDVNIKKIVGGRIAGALIDINVGKYLVQTDFAADAAKIQYNPKTIQNMDLLAGLNKENASKMPKLLAALKKVNTQAIVDEYLKKNLK